MQPSRPCRVRMEECRCCRDIVRHHAFDCIHYEIGDAGEIVPAEVCKGWILGVHSGSSTPNHIWQHRFCL